MMNTEQIAWRKRYRNLLFVLLGGGIFLPALHIKVYSFCLFEKVFAFPCPFCGLRSSVWALVQGNWDMAVQFHPLGPLTFSIVVGLFIYFFGANLFHLKTPWKTELFVIRSVNTACFSLLILYWLYKLLN